MHTFEEVIADSTVARKPTSSQAILPVVVAAPPKISLTVEIIHADRAARIGAGELASEILDAAIACCAHRAANSLGQNVP